MLAGTRVYHNPDEKNTSEQKRAKYEKWIKYVPEKVCGHREEQ
jgi:hypothetical protein